MTEKTQTNKMIPTRKIFSVVMFLCAAVFVSSQGIQIDKVLAVVGDNTILLSDVESQYQQMLNQNQGQPLPDDTRCNIFDNLLLERLFLSQALLDSVTTSPEEVEAELDRRIKYFISIFGSKEKLEEYYGKSVLELKDDFKDDIEKQLLADKMKGKAFTGLKVTPAEVKEFFDRIPADSVPYFNSELELGQIIMFPKVNQYSKDYALKKIQGIRESIIKGGDFSVQAMINSQDDGSARDGGSLGMVERGEMVPEFESVIFKLKEGEVSDVFESPFGFHIAVVDEIRGEKRKVRHILVKAQTTPSDLTAVADRMDSILHELRVDSLSWREAVNAFSEDEQSKSIGGLMTNPKTGTTYFEKPDIDGTLILSLDRLKVGEYSDVLAYNTQDRTGEMKKGYRIVWLKTETKPHKANLEQDYSKIQGAAKGEKQQKALEQWIKLHRSKNFVRIDDAMKNCGQIDKWLVK